MYNDWVAEWCSANRSASSVGTGAPPLQDPKRADEARRIVGLGLKAGFAPNQRANDRPLHHPVYTPVWEALEETGLPHRMPTRPGWLTCRASSQLGHLMAPGTHHAHPPLISR